MDFSGIISGKSVRATEFCAPVLEETNESSTWVQHNCISNKFISEARVVLTWRQTSNAEFLRKNGFIFFYGKLLEILGTSLELFSLFHVSLPSEKSQIFNSYHFGATGRWSRWKKKKKKKKKTTKAVVLLHNTIIKILTVDSFIVRNMRICLILVSDRLETFKVRSLAKGNTFVGMREGVRETGIRQKAFGPWSVWNLQLRVFGSRET